jgi:1,4-dihydroxy-6-naphthoate synthase
MPPISLFFSPCPNDTFIFDAMVNQKIDTEGIDFTYRMADVEELNRNALEGRPEMTKVSCHAWLYLRQKYSLLSSGCALVISREEFPPDELETRSIAIPGEYTTAHLLLKVFFPAARNIRNMIFHEIEDAVVKGTVDAGVIIHENRFTYEKKGLKKICDLGEYWEKKTGCPVPLGGIVVRKDLGPEMTVKLERIMKRSVQFALANPQSSMDFVKQNAQEMEDEVIKKHIQLYVNEFTVNLDEQGRNAIRNLELYSKDFMNADYTD